MPGVRGVAGPRAALILTAPWLLLAVAWTWPWATAGDVVFGRQFDLYGVLWVIEHARTFLPDLHSPISGLPDGEDLRRLDTWVLLAVGALTHGWLDPVRVTQALVIGGPVVSAIAAERCAARGLGVAPPFSAIAGVVWAFSGLGGTALLEGHVYVLADPWLPLLAWAGLRATGPGGTRRDGLFAGLAWGLAHATTAYLGLVGGLLVLALAVRGFVRRLDRPGLLAPGLGFLLGAGPFALAWGALFAAGSGHVASEPGTVLAGGSATLATLATWSPAIDLDNHSIAAPLGFATLALVAAAPVVLRDRGGWRTLLAVAVLAVLLALGPAVGVGMGGRGTWYWLDLRGASPIFGFLHFPVRMLWAWYLCAGLVAAQVAAVLYEQSRAAIGLLPLVVLDAFVTSAPPARLVPIDATIPSAYAAVPAGTPTLDLLAEDPHAGSGLDVWARRVACGYQVRHHLPLVARCLAPHGALTREDEERALRAALLDGEDPLPALAGLGVGAVALHLDLVHPDERDRMTSGLTSALGEPLARSSNGGETVVIWAVPRPAR